MRVRDSHCIVDIKEVIYGLSFGVMTFDLGSRSKVKNDILANISKSMRDGDSICIIDI